MTRQHACKLLRLNLLWVGMRFVTRTPVLGGVGSSRACDVKGGPNWFATIGIRQQLTGRLSAFRRLEDLDEAQRVFDEEPSAARIATRNQRLLIVSAMDPAGAGFMPFSRTSWCLPADPNGCGATPARVLRSPVWLLVV